MDSNELAGIITLVAMGLLVGIGVPLGIIGLQLLTGPATAIMISSYVIALMFLSFAFFAGIIVYTKVRLSVGVMKVKTDVNRK
jgi:hypothetical protein